VLPKEARLMMVSSLESANIFEADNLKDEEVLKKYNQLMVDMQAKVTGYETSKETKNLNVYANSNDKMKLEDKDMIARLFNLNVPSMYLHLFKDDDSNMTDRELWKVVNKSGIDPLKEKADLFKMKRSLVKRKEAIF
jgi:hypothetical protein